MRTGSLLMDNVEVNNCSQANTYNAAIRIENALTKHHRVTNCAIWGNKAWGISVLKSANVLV